MKLYNTLTRTLQPFEPLKPPAVTMYVCGPTVYDVPHIGHARSAYIFDVLRRHLESRAHHYQVTFVRNVTDIDDKIIERARQELGARGTGHGAGESLKNKCQEVAAKYLDSYHQALDQLGITRPTKEPKATEHVSPEMTDLISTLLMQGAAYEAKDGVYFAVRKFNGYGTLSNRTLDELQAGTRIEPGEQKQDPLDFALWKAAKPDEPSWPSPWGKGRPGWHIECSAMSTKYLGDTFDIHGGGVDLVFPHHENEIAQAHGVGKPFARYWVHNGLLTVNGEKMSKSLGNFVTVEHALKDCHGEPDALKILFLGAHYRSPIDYGENQATAAYNRWFGLKLLLEYADNERNRWDSKWNEQFPDKTSIPREEQEFLPKIRDQFQQSLDDDLNTPRALSSLDKLVEKADEWRERKDLLRQVREGEPMVQYRGSQEDPGLSLNIIDAADTLISLASILGLFLPYERMKLSPDEEALRQERDEARKRKDFSTADRIRKELDARGIVVEDAPDGSSVVRRKKL